MANEQRGSTFIEAARRAQIIECATETIAELGYAHTSLAQIAKRAGISKGVISYHFAGKDELIQQVLAETTALSAAFVTARINEHNTTLGRLRAHIEGNIEFIRKYPVQLRAMVEIITNARNDSGESIVDSGQFYGMIDLIAERFRLAQQTGELREFDPLVMAQTLRSAIDGLISQLARNPNLDLQAYGRELVTFFELAISKPSA